MSSNTPPPPGHQGAAPVVPSGDPGASGARRTLITGLQTRREAPPTSVRAGRPRHGRTGLKLKSTVRTNSCNQSKGQSLSRHNTLPSRCGRGPRRGRCSWGDPGRARRERPRRGGQGDQQGVDATQPPRSLFLIPSPSLWKSPRGASISPWPRTSSPFGDMAHATGT